MNDDQTVEIGHSKMLLSEDFTFFINLDDLFRFDELGIFINNNPKTRC